MKLILYIFLVFPLALFGQTIKAEKINFEVTPTYESLNDSVIYSLNKAELTNLLSKSTKKYTLVLSYGFWCKPCQEYMPKILKLVKENESKIDLFVISVEPDNSKRLFLHHEFLKKRFAFDQPSFSISEDYGNKKWMKYDAFLLDLIGEDKFNKTYTGMSQNILYHNNEIVYLSNYNLSDEKIISDLTTILSGYSAE